MNSAVSLRAHSEFRRASARSPRLILASGFQPDYVREVANAHARLGRAVEIIGGNMHEKQQYDAGVTLRNLRGDDARAANPVREVLKLATYYARVFRCVATSEAGIVYDVSIGRPLLRCLLMYPLFRLLGKRIVYTAHNVLPHDADTVCNRIVFWIVYRLLVNAIVVHGQAMKERLADEFGVNPECVSVVAHGAYHPLDSAVITREVARERLGIARRQRVLLCFGLQRFYKGTHFVIEALSRYRAENVTLLVRGHAPESSYRELIQRMAQSYRGGANIDAQFGAVPDEQMELLFKAADIVLLPYLEGSQSGIKFMAYAYGRPVLVSGAGSLREYVIPGITGEVFSPGEHAAFREVLEFMLARMDTYTPGRIFQYAREHCSFDVAARQVDILCETLSRKAAP